MEAFRGPTNSAALLPYEITLIEALGLTVDEYREFQRLTAEYNGERSDDIYPINNDPITQVVVSLVIGIALTAASAMMKPKPQKPPEQDTTQNLETGDNVGRSKFTPRYGFDSVQQLATLGKPVPLVFAHRCRSGLALHNTPVPTARITCGGIRVNTQLVWSQLISHTINQELRIAAVVGLAQLGRRPDYEGYAIGSTKLESYPQESVFLSFNENGQRPVSNNPNWTYIYEEGRLELPGQQPPDLLSTRVYGQNQGQWNLVSCSTHTPSTATSFGIHRQMPNGTAWMLPFSGELIPINQNSDGVQISEQETRDEVRMELIKTNIYMYPYGAGFVDPNDPNAYNRNSGRVQVRGPDARINQPGTSVFYKIGRKKFKDDLFNNQGVTEINDYIGNVRAEIDSELQYGEIYMINNFKAKLISRPGDVLEGNPSADRFYEFEALEKGQYRIMRGFDEENPTNKNFKRAGDEGVDIDNIDNLGGDREGDDLNNSAFGNNPSPQCSLIGLVDEALISNTRKCNATELGIKSNVWRKISMPNINSFPDVDATNNLEASGKNVILGQMSRYCERYSFFKIQYRRAGNGNNPREAGNNWNALHRGVKFAVKGDTPQDQYNFIRISHPEGERDAYEYKIVPVSGYSLYEDVKQDRQTIWLLNGRDRLSTGGGQQQNVEDGFRIAFSGQERLLSIRETNIKEFMLGPLSSDIADGAVTNISPTDNGKEIIPAWAIVEQRYTDPSQANPTDFNIPRNKVVAKTENGKTTWYYYWNDELIGTKGPNYYARPEWVIEKGRFKYKVGAQTFEGNTPPSWVRRFYIQKWGVVGEPVPNVEWVKYPDNQGQLRGSGFSIKVFAYNDPFDPNDQTKDAAFWTINTRGSGYRDGEIAKFTIRGVRQDIKLSAGVTGGQINYYEDGALSDYPQYEGEELSCQNGPEHELTYINELIYKNGNEASYEDLAYLTMRLRAGRSMTSFTQLSAYIKDGIAVERLIPTNVMLETVGPNYVPTANNPLNTEPWPDRYATCFLPEIVYALLTDPVIGVGELVGRYQVNRFEIQQAAIYCARNGFTWNGIIAERINIREWIYQQASYNLLDFTILGGRFALSPALLTKANGELDLYATPPISALFTDGNIRDLQIKFLDPAERAPFTCVCTYRLEEGNGFPQTQTVTVALAPNQSNSGYTGGNQDRDVVETFDLSDSVTTESHCLYFAKMALRARQCIDHNIEFTTVVSELVDVKPGDYIKVQSAATHGNSWNNGSIGPNGQVTSTKDISGGSTRILYWKPGMPGVVEATLNVDDNQRTGQADLWGAVFTHLGSDQSKLRCYKVSSISYGEEGEVKVTAAHSPLTYKYNPQGSLMLADWDEDDFIVETST